MKLRRTSERLRFKAQYVKVTVAGNVFRVVSMRDPPGASPIRRISGDMYVNIKTGQYGVYHKSETKADVVQGVRRSLYRLRMLISANCVDCRYLLWVTLTYHENMQDYKRLYMDFKRFWVRFLRYADKKGISSPEYISVAEPQGRGAWHLHVILLFNGFAPYIPNGDVASMWEQGFTKTKSVHGVDNLGAYFSAYLADMPVDDVELAGLEYKSDSVIEKCVVDDDERETRKKFVKGARLALYPAGMNFYRTSRGIARPRTAVLPPDTWDELKEKVGLREPTFSRSAIVLDDDNGSALQVNEITVDYYNAVAH